MGLDDREPASEGAALDERDEGADSGRDAVTDVGEACSEAEPGWLRADMREGIDRRPIVRGDGGCEVKRFEDAGRVKFTREIVGGSAEVN